jgi:kynurenine formamidase
MSTVIDISLKLDASYRHLTPDGVPNIQLEYELIKDYPGGAGQLVHAFHMRLHNGTHVDAPMHFVPGGATISDLPLETFGGEALLVDLTGVAKNAPILPADLEAALGGSSIEGARILLRTDWNHNYGREHYEAESPYLSRAGADWLAARHPLLVSYDYSHGKGDPDNDVPFYALQAFLKNGVATMGYVRNLDKIDPAKRVLLSAFPLAFQKVEASPVRAVVIQD